MNYDSYFDYDNLEDHPFRNILENFPYTPSILDLISILGGRCGAEILLAIALGFDKHQDILNFLGIENRNLNVYMKVADLVNYGLITEISCKNGDRYKNAFLQINQKSRDLIILVALITLYCKRNFPNIMNLLGKTKYKKGIKENAYSLNTIRFIILKQLLDRINNPMTYKEFSDRAYRTDIYQTALSRFFITLQKDMITYENGVVNLTDSFSIELEDFFNFLKDPLGCLEIPLKDHIDFNGAILRMLNISNIGVVEA